MKTTYGSVVNLWKSVNHQPGNLMEGGQPHALRLPIEATLGLWQPYGGLETL